MATKVCFFALITTLHFTSVLTEGIQCGQPGRPVNGTLSPMGKTYFPGEKITYSCLETFVLFGEETRTCLKNGTWSHSVPNCDFNLAKGKRTLQSANLWSYVPSLAVDGNKDSCSFTPKGPEPRWWQVHLGHKFNVVTIGVTISPGSFQEFTIFVIELLANNKALYKPCTEFKGVFQTHKGIFKCNDGLGHPGQYVYIRDDRKEEQYFGLCEVEVFAFRGTIPCGDPEVPVNAIVKRENNAQAIYSCERGYILDGDDTLTCSSKGEWQGLLPQCSEVVCPNPGGLKNGYFEVENPRGKYVFGTEVMYNCNPGYVINGNSRRVCEENGNWSNEVPTCQAITCGDPPVFENTKYTFLNGSNQRTSIVVYTCADGYKLDPNNEGTVTSCLEIGVWQFINVTCIPQVINRLDLLVRETGARSLDYTVPSPRNDTDRSDLVVTLAVVAGILAVGMIVFGVLLLRRRVMSTFGSLSPLVVRAHDTNLNVKEDDEDDSIKAGTRSTSYLESLGKSSNHFHSNLLQGISIRDYTDRFNYGSTIEEEPSCIPEPPYEQVRPDHGYETVYKENHLSSTGEDDAASSQDTNYESVPSDKESVGYETVANPKEPGYESVSNTKDPGYEVVKDTRDPGYEVVKDKESSKEKEPGYETVKDEISEPGYEIVRNDSQHIHGYETLKPKLPPRDNENGTHVPDILQDLSSDPETEMETSKMEEPAWCYGGKWDEIPAEIIALYAKVDKSKKNRKFKALSAPSSPPLPANHSILNSRSHSKESLDCHSSIGLSNSMLGQSKMEGETAFLQPGRGFLCKGRDLAGMENMRPLSSPVSLRSEMSSPTSSLRGSLRPLPPLPK